MKLDFRYGTLSLLIHMGGGVPVRLALQHPVQWENKKLWVMEMGFIYL